MITQRQLLIHTAVTAFSCGLLVICACSDSVVDPISYRPSERPPAADWVGHYANAQDTVEMEGSPTFVQAQLDLYTSPACQLYVSFSTAEPDSWVYSHSDSCLYTLGGGMVRLELRMRVHYPGGTDLIDAAATLEPVDEYWSAVVWRKMGIRLDRAAK